IPCNSQGMSSGEDGPLPNEAFFSPDSELFASVASLANRPHLKAPSTLTLINLATGRKRVSSDVSGIVDALRFAPDGRKLITGMKDGRLIDWDLELKAKVRMQLPGDVTELSDD